jgi:hydroxymethylbilane synthase
MNESLQQKTQLTKIKVGTRGSKLALTQTEMVCERLRAAHPWLETEIVIIKSSGDWKPGQGEIRLSEAKGGKGQYVQNIEDHMREGHIDIGVHSLKDVPTHMPDDLVVEHFMPRGDARDAFISHKSVSLDELPAGAVVGTSSPRRQAVILNRRPDLQVVTLRGNVDTRIEKLQKGQVDAMILAAVGLKRLGRESIISSYIEPEAMLPAVGQGTVAIESRKDDHVVHALLEGINHLETRIVTAAERSLLGVLDGSCGTPIGSYAMFIEPGVMRLRGFFASPDGTEIFHADENAPVASVEDAYALGLRVGRSLREMIPQAVLLSCVS